MKLPISMLRDWVETSLTPQQLGDLLTMAGFELEGLEEVDGQPVLDLKVVANRGDGLSAIGIAREVLAKDQDAKPTALYERAVLGFRNDEGTGLDANIAIETPSCTRYACRLFHQVVNGPSPVWLQTKVNEAGQRPISLLVDLTNYVMLETGQPLHAFDLDKLNGQQIIVRQAREGETLRTLNGVNHSLQSHHMVIADRDRAVALAGIMGGEETEVGPATQNMLLESAHFVNTNVRKTRKELNISTEASYRFERSVDPNGVVAALNRFAELYAEITGQRSVPGVRDLYPTKPIQHVVPIRLSRAKMILGIDTLDSAHLELSLSRLGFGVVGGPETYEVTVPTWRPDVTLEEDLIEEVGRVYGYEHIPESMPKGTTPRGGTFGLYSVIDTAKKTMLRCGLDQMWSHSLRDVHPLDFNPTRRVRVRNPHSPENAHLRNSLLPGLADAALRNGGRDVRLFEIGKVFVQGDYDIDESPELAILMTGNVRDPHWAQKNVTQSDFWTLKGMIEELSRLVRDQMSFGLPRLPDYRFHPTRQAGILVDEGRLWVGTMGQIHPDIAEDLGLPEETYMAELDLLVLFQNPDDSVVCRSISRNPAVRRDIAIVLPKSVDYAEVEEAIRSACGEVLEKQWLFDVYEGKGIDPGMHSLAIAMQFRKHGENFTDEEANAVRDRAIDALKPLGAALR